MLIFRRAVVIFAIILAYASAQIRADDASAYCEEGRRLLFTLGDPASSIPYFTRALQLDRRHKTDYYFLAMAHHCIGDGKAAIENARRYIREEGWREVYNNIHRSNWVVLFGYFGLRRLNQDDLAKEFLTEADAKCNKSGWPWPILQYIRGEITFDDLSRIAGNDVGKQIESQLYIGLDLSLKGQTESALTHLRWARDNSEKSPRNTLAGLEIDRIISSPPRKAETVVRSETKASEEASFSATWQPQNEFEAELGPPLRNIPSIPPPLPSLAKPLRDEGPK